MNDKFTVDFNNLAKTLMPKRAYRYADVEDRVEKVAYDLVRFRENEDTDQLWRIENSDDGPVIVALYGDDGGLSAESEVEPQGWEAVPDKKSMHVFYKGEHLLSLSSEQLGIPAKEFNVARRWIPKKLANDEELQTLLLGKVPVAARRLIAQRFPELTKVAQSSGLGIEEKVEDITSEILEVTEQE